MQTITKMNKANPTINIKELCAIFNIKRNTYYYQTNNKLNSKNVVIMDSIKQIAKTSKYTYGKRRICKSLQQKGIKIGIYKTKTLMNKANIIALSPKSKPKYHSTKPHKVVSNILNRGFTQQTINAHWVGDITYIKTSNGFCYLSSIVDLSSKKVVAYKLGTSPTTKLVKNTLNQAITRYKPNTNNLLFHSDQGVQYTSKEFTNHLQLLSITQSMSRRGNCLDNAVMERFFRSLKSKRLNYFRFENKEQLQREIDNYISFYNYKRIHSAIGYLTPNEKMVELMKKAA
jgi:transposase InsO family protein